MAISTAKIYQQPLFDPGDALFRRCLSVASAIGAAFALAALLTPVRQRVIERVEQLPPRFARLVLEPEKAVPAGEAPQEAQSPLATFRAPPGGGGGGGGGDGGP
ncbi:MAG TPA: hypothetical protein VI792_11930, partial [Candidatus Eisenbacteria bacterium]